MIQLEENSQAFIVRIWSESREIEHAQPEWRGMIEHIPSVQRCYVKSLYELAAFIVFRKTPTSGGESGKRFYRIIQSFKIVSSGRWARLRRQTYYGDGF